MKRVFYILKHPIIILGLLLVLGLGLFFLLHSEKPVYTQESVLNSVMEDLENKYPESRYGPVEYEILEINETKGDWYIKAKVSFTANPQCPKRIHLVYTYPETNFVPDPYKEVVKDCSTCLDQQVGCVLLYEEQAIIASHKASGTEAIRDFLQNHPNAEPNVQKQENYWFVTWSDSDNVIRVRLSEVGKATIVN
ncbi:hypothetical protein KO465_00525 [Candidatus Micrarchaeota archaeon]|jgi:hypothetical protein|nr:hypothetical protein [Candidatus Micrarchaeota archaeon]